MILVLQHVCFFKLMPHHMEDWDYATHQFLDVAAARMELATRFRLAYHAMYVVA